MRSNRLARLVIYPTNSKFYWLRRFGTKAILQTDLWKIHGSGRRGVHGHPWIRMGGMYIHVSQAARVRARSQILCNAMTVSSSFCEISVCLLVATTCSRVES